MVAKAADQAVWLVEGFVPGPKSVGVIEAVKMGAKPYPMLPQMGLMHGALGNEIVEFLQGNETAVSFPCKNSTISLPKAPCISPI